ncbi:hypothetical protein R3P38DRAFT_3178417 [Favolaschia claudopus]|uniref:Uncharacterized protein n=1 Tax=Favolaschia claudopus TaxID=2862362 RepID=A0AAW0CWR3_9AGAR
MTQTDADVDDFSRRLKISASPTRHSAKHSAHPCRLLNPDRDPIPMRSAPKASPSPSRDTAGRQLFDHRKDDPVRFVLRGKPPPTPKSSGEYVSASSTSSSANSMASSTFTLSSTTDGSSAPTYLLSSSRSFTVLSRTSDETEDAGCVLLKAKDTQDDDPERDKEREQWKRQIEDHKELAEIIHNPLEIAFAPSVPVSLRNIPTKYKSITHLRTFAFHKLQILKSLCCASFTSLGLDHKTER